MKKLLIAAATILLISCTKTNVTFKHRWVAKEWHDRTTFDAAVFCDSSKTDYMGTDTVELDNTTVYDRTKFGEQPGSIVFHIPNGKVPTDVPGIFDRYFSELKVQID